MSSPSLKAVDCGVNEDVYNENGGCVEEAFSSSSSSSSSLSSSNDDPNRMPRGGWPVPDEELTFDDDGLPIISSADLESCRRVLYLFVRFPEASLPSRFIRDTPQYLELENIRINAMRWMKPGKIPSVKEMLKSKKVEDKVVISTSGIRQGRNKKKRLLPNQIGQVLITDESNAFAHLLEHHIAGHEQDAAAEEKKEEEEFMKQKEEQTEREHSRGASDANSVSDKAATKKGHTSAMGDGGAEEAGTSKFIPFQRGQLDTNFRIHPNIYAAPLSKSAGPSVVVENDGKDDSDGASSDESSSVPVKKKLKASSPAASSPSSAPSSSSSPASSQPIPRTQHPSNFKKLSGGGTGGGSKQSSSVQVTIEDDHGDEDNAEGGEAVIMSPHATNDQHRGSSNSSFNTDYESNKNVKKGKQESKKEGVKKDLYGGQASFTATGAAMVDEELLASSREDTDADADEEIPGEEGKVEDSTNGRSTHTIAAGESRSPNATAAKRPARPRALAKAIPCYVCKTHFKVLHHFYDRMCPSCADLNWKKRIQLVDMRIRGKGVHASASVQRVTLVTGCRVKIGYEICLKLLRAGAFVIGVTRFPKDAALRFYREKDFNKWKDSLHIFSLDLRVLSAVEMFCAHVNDTYPRLDLIMNNAAQTIRRPPAFYAHLMQIERVDTSKLPGDVARLIREFVPDSFRSANRAHAENMITQLGGSSVHGTLAINYKPKTEEAVGDSMVKVDDATAVDEEGETCVKREGNTRASHSTGEVKKEEKVAGELVVPFSNSTNLVTMLSAPAAVCIPASELTQIPMVAGDEAYDEKTYPVGQFDKDDQQIDLREKTTWVMQLHEVSIVEMAEVQLVNSMSPFIINSKLKNLMKKSKDPSHIVNVTSMEGKFRGFKDTTHPHTNMAKAALNMMTHTSSKDYAHDRIFMNSVDTGWITEELPYNIAVEKAKNGFAPPLDEVDGAARCLDPVFTSILTGVYEFGKFFKDFAEAHW